VAEPPIDQAGPIDGDGLELVPVPAEQVDAVISGDIAPYVAGPGWPRDDTAIALSFRAVQGMTWLVAVDGIVVGELGTKAPPDPAGEVEIGYGLAAPSRRRGIGTRAVAALVDWLLARDDVQAVIAHVDPDNTPSVRLLRRLGFRYVETSGSEHVYRR
jgi:RimJ/RimL family protein N-acetyltransferase